MLRVVGPVIASAVALAYRLFARLGGAERARGVAAPRGDDATDEKEPTGS